MCVCVFFFFFFFFFFGGGEAVFSLVFCNIILRVLSSLQSYADEASANEFQYMFR